MRFIGIGRSLALLIVADLLSVMTGNQPFAHGQTPTTIHAAPSARNSVQPRRLPPIAQAKELARDVEPLQRPSFQIVEPVQRASYQPILPAPRPPAEFVAPLAEFVEQLQVGEVDEPKRFPIDLATALRLADADNLQVALAREQVAQAMARVDAADVLWLPSLRGGVSYNRHEGAIQAVAGEQFNTSRGALYAGAGAGGFGAGSPAIPGLYAQFRLADALFQPLAARQFAGSRNRAARATTNNTLLQVSLAFFELLRADEEAAISRHTSADAEQLAKLTADYAASGAGLPSDANRARAELALRVNDVQRASEAQRVASARLAQMLRLDPCVALAPAEEVVVPLEIVPPQLSLRELIAQALSQRPELAENQLLVNEAVLRLRRERLTPLIPSILMGTSYGGMGAGINRNLAPFHERLDVDAMAYWEMRNLGFGEAAARRGAQADLRATQVRQMAVLDQVAREVVEAHAQVQSRRTQMTTARVGVQAALASQQQNLERIEQAKGLPIEVLQSIQALAQSRREYLRTLIDYNTAQFTLYRALGWPAMLPREIDAQSGS